MHVPPACTVRLQASSAAADPAQHRAQRDAGDEFHHDVKPAVGVAGVVNGDDARVVEGGGGMGLELEPAHGGRVGHGLEAQDLDGDAARQLRIARSIDLPHAAGPEGLDIS